MPAFLTNNQQNQCCCPEMRCCVPSAISATCTGWNGVGMNIWLGIVLDAPAGFPTGLPDLAMPPHACAYETGTTGCFHWWFVECEPSLPDGKYRPGFQDCTLAEGAIAGGCQGVVWPSVAFTQMNGQTDQVGPFSFLCNGGGGGGTFGDSKDAYVTGWEVDPGVVAKCSVPGASKLCQNPGDGVGSIVYGPAGNQYGRVRLTDQNGTYVCHRNKSDLRPEFVATVIRSAPSLPEDTDARIVFDVFCRRMWQYVPDCGGYVIINLTCAVSDTPPEDPPEGIFYCIDYRCGPRVPGPFTGDASTSVCDQYKCTAHEGTVWPHLLAFDDTGNYSADLKLVLVPDAYFKNTEYYYQGAKPQKAMTWKIKDVVIEDGGNGYSVGDFFTVDFDPMWMSDLEEGGTGGGELNIGFPQNDWECFGYPLTWKDKYGLEPEQTPGGGKIYRQRLRVSKVDEEEGGVILELEIVPWFRTPEFRPGQCIDELPNSKKTPYYPAYTRVICHPNSVDIGGVGYRVNDQIKFSPISPGVVTETEAIAKVVDVDDDGAVLDWEIKGSDSYYYGFGMENPACAIWGQPDQRGAYRWPDKYWLCELYWHGVGVPVRSVNNYGDGFTGYGSVINTGTLTELTVSIARVPCRTAISVWLVPYKYSSLSFEISSEDEDATADVVALKKFPPYPKCFGGGAQITPVIGTPGGNESAIGGPLVGGEVKSGGDYYAFVDKTHIAPVLPKDVPNIGQGTGAKILSFAFGQVSNFPFPGYAAGELYVPSPSRFAYFPVTSATIDGNNRGTGYEIGQEFEVKPVGGVAFSHPWRKTGGDDPDLIQDGAWYASQRTTPSGHIPSTPEQEAGASQREGTCTLRVADVNEDGGIISLEVVHGGMMFRPQWASGVRHPDVMVVVNSDTGQGARATVTIDTNKNSTTFGEVTGCSIVQIPVTEATDPLHPPEPGENPVPWPLGGRDYANPPSGFMWEMNNIVVGTVMGEPATMMSYIDWHNFVYNAYHPSKSPYVLHEGGLPPFHRRAEHCSLDECYHGLLNRSYPLYRIYGGLSVNPPGNAFDSMFGTEWRVNGVRGCLYPGRKMPDPPSQFAPFPTPASGSLLNARPKVPYGVFRRKGTVADAYDEGAGSPCDCVDYELDYLNGCYFTRIDSDPEYDGPPVAEQGDYVVVEWGYSVSLSAITQQWPNCTNHESGRTSP